jgi:glycerol kinase
VRATLEAVGYQTRDLMLAMHADLPDDRGDGDAALRVDGGMVVNSWMCQFLADILDIPVERPVVTETTALGAAYLAGLAVGLYPSLESLSQVWRCERRFEPKMSRADRDRLYAGWLDAIRRSRGAVASATAS